MWLIMAPLTRRSERRRGFFGNRLLTSGRFFGQMQRAFERRERRSSKWLTAEW